MAVITSALLRQISPTANQAVIDGLAPHLDKWMQHYSIDTSNEIHQFLAQLKHESDHFKTMEEYASGDAYEGRRDLGNIYAGDGRRFKGHGPIQITGRHNHKFYGERIGVDLIANPERAMEYEIGVRLACEFWTVNGLGKIAETDRGIIQGADGKFIDTTELALREITRRINGGYNGLNDRRAALKKIKSLLPGVSLAAAEVQKTKYVPAPVDPTELPQAPIAATPPEPWYTNPSIQATGATFATSIINGINNPYSLAAIALVIVAACAVGFAWYRKSKRDAIQYPVGPVQ